MLGYKFQRNGSILYIGDIVRRITMSNMEINSVLAQMRAMSTQAKSPLEQTE